MDPPTSSLLGCSCWIRSGDWGFKREIACPLLGLLYALAAGDFLLPIFLLSRKCFRNTSALLFKSFSSFITLWFLGPLSSTSMSSLSAISFKTPALAFLRSLSRSLVTFFAAGEWMTPAALRLRTRARMDTPGATWAEERPSTRCRRDDEARGMLLFDGCSSEFVDVDALWKKF